MDKVQQVSKWKQLVTPAIDSKVDELQLLGYNKATRQDVWNCLVEKVWKGDPEKRLHETVHDIMHMRSSTYLSYLTVHSYENDDLSASISALLELEARENEEDVK